MYGGRKMINSKVGSSLFKYTLSFDDMLLVPKYSNIESRSEVDLTSNIRDMKFELPIVSSPMDTVTESEMSLAMSRRGGLGVIHRYNSIEEQVRVTEEVLSQSQRSSAALGVTGDYMDRAAALYDAGVRIFCLDIAHGHHVLMERAIKNLRQKYGSEVYLIAGNVAMAEGYLDLSSWGADAVRVGIGGGSICSTRIQTGHGVPTLQSVMACHLARGLTASKRSKNYTPAKIVADGGIRTAGDVVKSLAAGADFVMLGSMLAGTKESPGTVFQEKTGGRYKVYRGMASPEAQEAWRGEARSLEGVSTTVPYKGSVYKILESLSMNIRSGFSYTGARNITELRERCEFVIQSPAGQNESSVHILNRK
jgi:IMP dehydrogenase